MFIRFVQQHKKQTDPASNLAGVNFSKFIKSASAAILSPYLISLSLFKSWDATYILMELGI
jgi:hypothetical protein